MSHYNTFVKLRSGHYLSFNAMTSALALLEPKTFKYVQKLLSHPNGNYKKRKMIELRRSLVRGGFIINHNVDEQKLLKVRNRLGRFTTKELILAVAPTLRCNFRCIYCYENKGKAVMTNQIKAAFVLFVKKRAPGLRHLQIHWYGGEPLLCPQTIIYLSKKFKEICRYWGINYTFRVITNGYLFTPSLMKNLFSSGIRSVHFSLDGPEEIHNRRRPLASGKGTFKKIIGNLKEAAQVFESIDVRINVDRANVKTVPRLLDELAKIEDKGRIFVYFAQVTSRTNACVSVAGNCLVDNDFATLEVDLFKMAMDRGFNIHPGKYPRARNQACFADMLNAYVVGPSGELYKCWETLGNTREIVGYLDGLGSKSNNNLTKWLAWDPFERTECTNCPLLPHCMGGCPLTSMQNKLHTPGDCSPRKHNLKKILTIYYRHLTNYNKGNNSKKGGEKNGLFD